MVSKVAKFLVLLVAVVHVAIAVTENIPLELPAVSPPPRFLL